MKIYLIRHGETDWNRQLRIQGRENVALNQAGIRQAAECGKALAGSGEKITAVYVSPLDRAILTGQTIAAQINLDKESVQILPELIERDLGAYSGQIMKDKAQFFGLSAGEDGNGMEPFASVLTRMQQALLKIAGTENETVAVVSHGAAINILLAKLSDHACGTSKTKLYNGGITVLEGDEKNGFHLVHCNLRPEEFTTMVQLELF